MIAGHESTTEDDILIGAVNVTGLPPAKRGTAMMFQSYALFPHLSCVDNVAFSLKMKGVDKTTRRAKAMENAGMMLNDPSSCGPSFAGSRNSSTSPSST